MTRSASTAARDTVGAADIARGLVGLVADTPTLIRPVLRTLPGARSQRCVGGLFQARARAYPDRPLLRFEGNSISYADANAQANRYASFLAAQGVKAGDVVAILARNQPVTVLAMLATVKLGAIAGMLNYNQRGDVLEHSLRLLDAKVVLVDPGVDVLDSVPVEAVPSARYTFTELDAQSAGLPDTNPAGASAVDPHTPALYIFTSGTTGLPKASIMSHRRWVTAGFGFGMAFRLRPDDVLFSALPLYHNNAITASLAACVNSGACFAIGAKFSASRFWDDVIANDATAFTYIGELCRYLLAQPRRDVDRSHRIRVAGGNGLRPEIWQEFTTRFGIGRIAEFYAGSELPSAAINFLGIDRTVGFCPPIGRAIVAYDPETGQPARNAAGKLTKVNRGEAGLLMFKDSALAPFEGYTDDKATEGKRVRGAFKKSDTWVNTGDLVREQGFGHILFVDRLGDTFRWKGENVATTEVEGALIAHPAIDQAVVYGVEVPGADGRAGMAAVTLTASADLTVLATDLADRLPNYAVPLFIRVVETIEQTSTFKNQKVALRNQAYHDVGDDTVYALTADGYAPYYPAFLAEVARPQR